MTFGRQLQVGIPKIGLGLGQAQNPFLPQHEEVDAEREVLAETPSGGWFFQFLTGLEQLTGAHMIRSLISGDVEGAVRNNPVFQLAEMLLPEGLEPEFIKAKPVSFSDVRAAWGNNDAEEGIGNFAINMIGDILTDPFGVLWKPFGATAKGVATLKGGGKISASLANAVQDGSRKLLTMRNLFNGADPWSVTLPKNLDLAFARGIDAVRNFMATNEISGPLLRQFQKYGSNLATPDERAYFKEVGRAAEDKGRAFKAAQDRLLDRQVKRHPEVFRDPATHYAFLTLMEVGVDELDNAASALVKIQNGPAYARAQRKLEKLLSPEGLGEASDRARELEGEIRTALSKGDVTGLEKAVKGWRTDLKRYPLPSTLTKFGSSLSDIDAFANLAGITLNSTSRRSLFDALEARGVTLIDDFDIPALHRGRTRGLASFGLDEGRKLVSEQYTLGGKSAQEQAIKEGYERTAGIFQELFEGNPNSFETVKAAALDARAWLDQIGETNVASGMLSAVSELFVPRQISDNPQIRDFIDGRFSQTFRNKKLSTMNVLEASIFMRDNGSKVTNFRPVRLADQSDHTVPLQKAWSKIFDRDFIKKLKKMGDEGQEAAQFFQSNPYVIFKDHIAQAARGVEHAEFYSKIFAEDSPFIMERTTIADLERNMHNTRRGLRPLLVHRNQAGTVRKWSRDTQHVVNTAVLNAETEAEGFIQRFDLESWFKHERSTQTKGYYDQVKELDAFQEMIGKSVEVQGPVISGDYRTTVLSSGKVVTRPARHTVTLKQGTVETLAAKFGEANPFVRNERRVEVVEGLLANIKAAHGGWREARKSLRAARKALPEDFPKGESDEAADAFLKARDAARAEPLEKYTETKAWIRGHRELRQLKKKRMHLLSEYKDLQSQYREAAAEVTSELRGMMEAGKKSFGKLVAEELFTTKDQIDRFNLYMQYKRDGYLAIDELQTANPALYEKVMGGIPKAEVSWVDQEVYSKLFGAEAALDRLSNPSSFMRSLGWFDTALDMWKGWTTTHPLFLASRARDHFSGMFLQIIDGGLPVVKQLPKAMTQAYQLTRKVGEWLQTGTVVDDLTFTNGTETFKASELLNQFSGGGLVNNSLFRDTVAVKGATLINELPSIKDVAQKKARAWDYFKTAFHPNPDKNAVLGDGRELAGFLDNHVKITGTLARWFNGEPLKDAMFSARKSSYDPMNAMLSPFEKNVMRRTMPFYTFWKFAMGFTFDKMMERPATISWMRAAHDNAVKAAGLKPEEWDAFMPEFVKTQFGIPIERADDGTLEVRLFGGFIPMTEVGKLADAIKETFVDSRPGGSLLEYGMSMSNPMLKSVIEQAWNYSFFTGRDLEQYPGEQTEYMGVVIPRRLKSVFMNLRLLNEIDNLGLLHFGDVEGLLKDQNKKTNPLEQLALRSGFSPLGAFKGYQVDLQEQAHRAQTGGKLEVNKLKAQLRRAAERAATGDRASEENLSLIRHEIAKKMAKDQAITEGAGRLGLPLDQR